MAQLDKMVGQLLEQREAKQAALDQVPPAAPAEPPAAPARVKPASTSKRSTWKACTFYLPAETKARLKRVLLQQELAGTGSAADQSEAINEALLAWLEKAERAAT